MSIEHLVDNTHCLLNDKEIAMLCKSEQLISPMSEQTRTSRGISKGLTPCGYDIELDDEFMRFEGNTMSINKNECDGNWIKYSSFKDGSLMLTPGRFILGQSKEYFKMPSEIFGICFLKSTWVRTGLIISPTTLQPGWEGKITLEFTNPTSHNIIMYANEGIANVVFWKITKPASFYSGLYQKQYKIETAKTN